jgi:uncharacterized protein
MIKFIITLVLGFAFGSLLIMSEAFSWYRIQEMFHFQSFHMFGLLFSAILTAAISLFIIKRLGIKSLKGEDIEVKPKPLQLKANVIGGLVFGSGWAISGACSAPVYILIGMHWEIGFLIFIGAIIGTLIYGLFKNSLPH